MTFTEFCNEANSLGWGDNPPTEAPRHIFALYVASFEAGLTPQQFMKLMAARAFVATTTAALINDKVPFSKAEKFIELHQKGTHPKEAVPQLFSKHEVQDQHLGLFDETINSNT